MYRRIKLKELVHIVSGGAFKSTFFTEEKEGIPLIRIRDVNRGYSETFYTGDFDERHIIYDGDFLITMDGEFKINEWVGGKALLNQRVCKIESKSDNLLQRFLLYIMPTILKEIEDKTPFVTVKHLSVKKINDIEINLPSINEQQRIINVLDRSLSVMKKRQQQIEALSALKQSVFLDMFGDPRTNKFNFPLKSFSFFAEIDTRMINDFEGLENAPHIGIGDIEKNSGEILNYETVQEANIKSGKYLFGPNHIIYSKIRPNLNKVAIPNFEGVCSADAYPILVKEDTTNKIFFAHLLRSDAFLDYINSVSSRTNIPKANKKQLKEFNGIYPPFNIQELFGEKVRVIDSKIELLEESLDQINNLYNSLLHKAFNGELFKEEMKA